MNREETVKSIQKKMFDLYIGNYEEDMLEFEYNGLSSDYQFKIELRNADDIAQKLSKFNSIYVYMSPKKEVLQLLGNFVNDDGKQSKKLIYNFKNKLYGKDKKTLNDKLLTRVFRDLHLFANLAEQLRLYRNLELAEQEEIELYNDRSNKIDQGKILKFLAK